MRSAIVSAACFFLCCAAGAAEKPTGVQQAAQMIEVTARPLTNTRFTASATLPRLEWVGGLDLFSSAKGFGGFSGLSVGENGRDGLAISDAGVWLKFEIATDGEIPLGIKRAELASLLDPQGKNISGSRSGDTESMALMGGNVFVGFEGAGAIWRYPLLKDGMAARPVPVSLPAEVKQLRRTRGLETLAAFPPGSRYAGALLAIAEAPARHEDNLRAWIIDGENFRRLTVLQSGDYMATDAAFLENGDLLLLERRFRPPFGVSARIRTINGNEISGGARLDGKTIFEADIGAPIDNMEGIAVHKGADGATYVSMISDDNFNIFQRTLLLRFRLIEK